MHSYTKGYEGKIEYGPVNYIAIDAALKEVFIEELKAKNLEKEEKLLARKESLQALGGQSPAGTKPAKPAKLTDTEYAEALERGEVNPLKEDGFI